MLRTLLNVQDWHGTLRQILGQALSPWEQGQQTAVPASGQVLDSDSKPSQVFSSFSLLRNYQAGPPNSQGQAKLPRTKCILHTSFAAMGQQLCVLSTRNKTVCSATAKTDCEEQHHNILLRRIFHSGPVLTRLRNAGHTQRLGRVGFHPQGNHFGTASFDGTWRLWDVSTGDCLLEQEGHSRSVYALAFHPDGSLAASGGLDAYGISPCFLG